MPTPTRELASFPNSRIKPRPATQEISVSLQFTLPNSGVVGTRGAPVKILSYNENRTYFTLENFAAAPNSPVNSMKFAYAPIGAEGVAPDFAIYGFTIAPGGGMADQPSPQEIWAVNESDNDALTAVVGSIEEGQG